MTLLLEKRIVRGKNHWKIFLARLILIYIENFASVGAPPDLIKRVGVKEYGFAYTNSAELMDLPRTCDST